MNFFVNPKNKKTVYVAMSGGVDSSLAAALLKRQGYRVVGAYMKNWSESLPGIVSCPWEEDEKDARMVAGMLGIPFYTFDFESAYRQKVVAYMLDEYAAGRTPNPDVMCNREIKFGLFLTKARELGADFVATGHYARVRERGGVYHIYKGVDPAKDQSYFLWTLTQDELHSTLFPVGKYHKTEVRALAKKFGLPTYAKKDSQGLCFIGKMDVNHFLHQHIPAHPGDIVDTAGCVLGRHEGLPFYTIGQREGLHIGGTGPYYVVAKDAAHNTVIVCHERDKGKFLLHKELVAESVSWISGREPRLSGKGLRAAIRYHAPEEGVALKKLPHKEHEQHSEQYYASAYAFGPYAVHFRMGQPAATPGQSIVFYCGEEMLGGGVIA